MYPSKIYCSYMRENLSQDQEKFLLKLSKMVNRLRDEIEDFLDGLSEQISFTLNLEYNSFCAEIYEIYTEMKND